MEVKELMNPGVVWVEPTATAALAARQEELEGELARRQLEYDALAAAQHIKDLNRHPIGRVSGKLHDQMGAGPHAVAVGAVADSQQLLHAVMAQQHPAA